LKYFIIFTLFSFLVGCANSPIDLVISNKYAVSDLIGMNKVIKSGEFIAVIGKNDKKLAITENSKFGFDNSILVDSKVFFDHLYNDSENIDTKLGKYVREFRSGFLLDGFQKKEILVKNDSTVYIWISDDNKFVAIVNDHSSEYFLNIVGENVSPKKILNIIVE